MYCPLGMISYWKTRQKCPMGEQMWVWSSVGTQKDSYESNQHTHTRIFSDLKQESQANVDVFKRIKSEMKQKDTI